MKPELDLERAKKVGTKTMDEIWIQGGRSLKGTGLLYGFEHSMASLDEPS